VRWVGHVASVGKMRNAYNILVGKPEGNRKLEKKHRHRWKDNIEMYLRGSEWEHVEYIHLAQDRANGELFVFQKRAENLAERPVVSLEILVIHEYDKRSYFLHQYQGLLICQKFMNFKISIGRFP
jgi:hypothetical protein